MKSIFALLAFSNLAILPLALPVFMRQMVFSKLSCATRLWLTISAQLLSTSLKSSKLLSLLVKILFCVNFLSSFSVVCPIEKIFKFSKELNFAKLRTPLGLKKQTAS